MDDPAVATGAEAVKKTVRPPAAVDVSVIIPVFNEVTNIAELHRRLSGVLASSGRRCEIIFVDDGSTDGSFAALSDLHAQHSAQVKVLHLSRNFGHQLALTAGLSYCRGTCAVVMDADLQDPPETIPEFLKKWEEGYDIVYGVRRTRAGETVFKRLTASVFYALLHKIAAVEIPQNVGDFYLLDRKVVNIVNALKERHRFIRGLVAWVGFKRIGVEYDREPRHSGTTKYGCWKMLKFSFDAMTSFSFTPLRVVSGLGAFFSIVAFFAILLIIYVKVFTDATVIGWSSLMAVILFLGGIQLLAIGIIGEYVARIGDDVKARPLYAVSEVLD